LGRFCLIVAVKRTKAFQASGVANMRVHQLATNVSRASLRFWSVCCLWGVIRTVKLETYQRAGKPRNQHHHRLVFFGRS